MVGLANILKVGEAEKKLGTTNGVNLYAQMIEEAEGLEKIKNLLRHVDILICKKAVQILGTYWMGHATLAGLHFGGFDFPPNSGRKLGEHLNSTKKSMLIA